MKLGLLWVRPLVKALNGVHEELRRMNDMRELQLHYEGIHVRPAKADVSGAAPEVIYTDEEVDAVRELLEMRGRQVPPGEFNPREDEPEAFMREPFG